MYDFRVVIYSEDIIDSQVIGNPRHFVENGARLLDFIDDAD